MGGGSLIKKHIQYIYMYNVQRKLIIAERLSARQLILHHISVYVCMYVTLRNVRHASGTRNWVWLHSVNLFYLQTDLLLA